MLPPRSRAPPPCSTLKRSLSQSRWMTGCGEQGSATISPGDAPGFVRMELNAEQAKKANTGARYTRPGGVIPVETVDSWNLPSLGFLKLDIEGSEPLALRGAKDTLRRCKPIVLFEAKFLWVHNHGLPKDAVSTFLKQQNYRFIERVSRDEIWGPR